MTISTTKPSPPATEELPLGDDFLLKQITVSQKIPGPEGSEQVLELALQTGPLERVVKPLDELNDEQKAAHYQKFNQAFYDDVYVEVDGLVYHTTMPSEYKLNELPEKVSVHGIHKYKGEYSRFSKEARIISRFDESETQRFKLADAGKSENPYAKQIEINYGAYKEDGTFYKMKPTEDLLKLQERLEKKLAKRFEDKTYIQAVKSDLEEGIINDVKDSIKSYRRKASDIKIVYKENPDGSVKTVVLITPEITKTKVSVDNVSSEMPMSASEKNKIENELENYFKNDSSANDIQKARKKIAKYFENKKCDFILAGDLQFEIDSKGRLVVSVKVQPAFENQIFHVINEKGEVRQINMDARAGNGERLFEDRKYDQVNSKNGKKQNKDVVKHYNDKGYYVEYMNEPHQDIIAVMSEAEISPNDIGAIYTEWLDIQKIADSEKRKAYTIQFAQQFASVYGEEKARKVLPVFNQSQNAAQKISNSHQFIKIFKVPSNEIDFSHLDEAPKNKRAMQRWFENPEYWINKKAPRYTNISIQRGMAMLQNWYIEKGYTLVPTVNPDGSILSNGLDINVNSNQIVVGRAIKKVNEQGQEESVIGDSQVYVWDGFSKRMIFDPVTSKDEFVPDIVLVPSKRIIRQTLKDSFIGKKDPITEKVITYQLTEAEMTKLLDTMISVVKNAYSAGVLVGKKSHENYALDDIYLTQLREALLGLGFNNLPEGFEKLPEEDKIKILKDKAEKMAEIDSKLNAAYTACCKAFYQEEYKPLKERIIDSGVLEKRIGLEVDENFDMNQLQSAMASLGQFSIGKDGDTLVSKGDHTKGDESLQLEWVIWPDPKTGKASISIEIWPIDARFIPGMGHVTAGTSGMGLHTEGFALNLDNGHSIEPQAKMEGIATKYQALGGTLGYSMPWQTRHGDSFSVFGGAMIGTKNPQSVGSQSFGVGWSRPVRGIFSNKVTAEASATLTHLQNNNELFAAAPHVGFTYNADTNTLVRFKTGPNFSILGTGLEASITASREKRFLPMLKTLTQTRVQARFGYSPKDLFGLTAAPLGGMGAITASASASLLFDTNGLKPGGFCIGPSIIVSNDNLLSPMVPIVAAALRAEVLDMAIMAGAGFLMNGQAAPYLNINSAR